MTGTLVWSAFTACSDVLPPQEARKRTGRIRTPSEEIALVVGMLLAPESKFKGCRGFN